MLCLVCFLPFHISAHSLMFTTCSVCKKSLFLHLSSPPIQSMTLTKQNRISKWNMLTNLNICPSLHPYCFPICHIKNCSSDILYILRSCQHLWILQEKNSIWCSCQMKFGEHKAIFNISIMVMLSFSEPAHLQKRYIMMLMLMLHQMQNLILIIVATGW